MIVTRPTKMQLMDWADAAVNDLNSYGAFGRLSDETQWQNWAVQFLNNTTIGRNLPNPYHFETWSDWAERFVGALS